MSTEYRETDCTFTHEEHTFESGGAIITDDYLIAYPSDKATGKTQKVAHHGLFVTRYLPVRELHDWHGNVIGEWYEVSSWRAIFFGRESWQGTRYYAMRARLTDGREYSLRGFGVGMIARGKRIKSNRA